MSTLPDNEFDLEKLFLPAWASEATSSKYAHYEGETERPDRRDRRGPRPPRRDGPPGGRRDDQRPGGDRRQGQGQGQRGPRPEGDRRGGPGQGPRRGEDRERREAPAPLPELSVSLVPEEKGVEFLARQVRMTGRAYPLFDIAQMILQKPERHIVEFSVQKGPDGKPLQPLFLCALDDTLWLTENEAVEHVMRKHFATFYQPERTATEPPKGKYTFVAQCGMSGIVLGPPNHHDYQNQLRKLHAERFSRMPFEAYKARVRIVRDDAVVKKWVEDQSFKTEYLCLNMPEPLRLPNMEAVEKHFRESHKDNIIKPVESHKLNGAAARNLRSPQLVRLVRSVWEDQRRFPLQIATVLSQQFAGHGLQFFKVNKTVTHVSVARPHFLDMEATPVSNGVKKIVDYIDSHPKCSRRQLIESLAPSPASAPAPGAPASQPAEAQAPSSTLESAGPTSEQTAVIADLHWLVHQGHVIEFASGNLETAKKPAPRPPKPQPKAEPKPPAESAPGEGAAPAVPTAESPAPAGEPTMPAPTAPTETAPGSASESADARFSQPGEAPAPVAAAGTEASTPFVRPSDAPAAVVEHPAQPGAPEANQTEEPPAAPEPEKPAS